MDASPPLSRQLGKVLWYGYSPDLEDAAVRAMFTIRFGYLPQEVIRGPSVVLCGPVMSETHAGASDSDSGIRIPK